MFVNVSCMKTPVVALLTNDPNLEECLAQVLLKTGALRHLADNASDVLELVCTIGQDLDLAVIDCEHGPHGLMLLAAISKRRDDFPVIAITAPGEPLIEALAYANGATACLSQPVSLIELTEAITRCCPAKFQPTLVTSIL